jgi:hypothetical protein
MRQHGAKRLKDAEFVKPVTAIDMVLTSFVLMRHDRKTLEQVS